MVNALLKVYREYAAGLSADLQAVAEDFFYLDRRESPISAEGTAEIEVCDLRKYYDLMHKSFVHHHNLGKINYIPTYEDLLDVMDQLETFEPFNAFLDSVFWDTVELCHYG